MSTPILPMGVRLNHLKMHQDSRGVFTEVFREEWDSTVRPIQWNLVKSQKNVLRGVHVHVKHYDYLVLLEGHMSVGLHDMREESTTKGLSSLISLKSSQFQSLTIPPGVLHGFFFYESSLLLHAASEYWDGSDEFDCHWLDPELNIPWGVTTANLSQRDVSAQSFKALQDQLSLLQLSLN